MSTYESNAFIGHTHVEVVMGWDPVLKRFFLVIEDPESEDERPRYSNLDDKELDANPEKYQDLDYFKAKTASFGITVPAYQWEAVAQDKAASV